MPIVQITETNFHDAVLASETPVLLDLWADWCAPCRALAPVLERIAQIYGATLSVARLDIDANPALKDRLVVRSIPTLLLFRDGAEVGRMSGVRPYTKLVAWLRTNNVPAPKNNAAPERGETQGRAFYGDPDLKRFFFDRVLAHARSGEILPSRQPYWGPKGGTISSAFTRQMNPAVFERMTGLPISAGLAMEFARITTVEQVEHIFATIRPGADLPEVAPRLMLAWLGDAGRLTPQFLDDDRLAALRMDWTQTMSAALTGVVIAYAAWTDLRQRAATLCKEISEECEVPRTVARMLTDLSPPPGPDEGGAWLNILLRDGRDLARYRGLYEAGYTHRHFVLEGVRHRFCSAVGDGRQLDADVVTEIRHRWETEHGELQCLIDEMMAFWRDAAKEEHGRIADLLITLVMGT